MLLLIHMTVCDSLIALGAAFAKQNAPAIPQITYSLGPFCAMLCYAMLRGGLNLAHPFNMVVRCHFVVTIRKKIIRLH